MLRKKTLGAAGFCYFRPFCGPSGHILVHFDTFYACFIVFIPWENINRTEGFRDFKRQELRYNNTTPDGSKIKVYKLNTVVKFFTGEVLWDEMMIRI